MKVSCLFYFVADIVSELSDLDWCFKLGVEISTPFIVNLCLRRCRDFSPRELYRLVKLLLVIEHFFRLCAATRNFAS